MRSTRFDDIENGDLNASLSDARIRVMAVRRKPLKLRKIPANLEGQLILPRGIHVLHRATLVPVRVPAVLRPE